MVAAGQLDAYYEDGVNVWDWAAGALVAAEAGARVSLPTPAGAVGGRGLVVASAPGVAEEFDEALRRVGVRR
jgi:myo-inositol-1(or 4)-monophosphatase